VGGGVVCIVIGPTPWVGGRHNGEDRGARVIGLELCGTDSGCLGGNLPIDLVEIAYRARDLLQCLRRCAPCIVARLRKQAQVADRIVGIEPDDVASALAIIQIEQQSFGLVLLPPGRFIIIAVAIKPRAQERRHQQQCFELLARGLRCAIGLIGGGETLVGERLGLAPGEAELQPGAEIVAVKRDELLVKTQQPGGLIDAFGAADRAQNLHSGQIAPNALDACAISERALGDLRNVGLAEGDGRKQSSSES
jgi:hypothetical protein